MTEESHKQVREPAVQTLKDEDLFVVDKVIVELLLQHAEEVFVTEYHHGSSTNKMAVFASA